jgi:hypothetical protein
MVFLSPDARSAFSDNTLHGHSLRFCHFDRRKKSRDSSHTFGMTKAQIMTARSINFIERLWKFVKKKCLYSQYYSDFTIFKQSNSGLLDTGHLRYKKELASLLTLRFQSFKKKESKAQVVAA